MRERGENSWRMREKEWGNNKLQTFSNFKLSERVSQDLHKYGNSENCSNLEGVIPFEEKF